ncbi:ribonucleoside-diphosphate reductase subunit alpha [Kiritimatiellota bacterium B12222]|nr:ribonucleoside-diphosphate reductase subunit alpha [Kiritimatiellota bacterium B12222]
MIRNQNTLEEDQLLKQHSLRPRSGATRFNWADVVSEQSPINLKLTSDGGEKDLSPAEVAEIIGDALTTLLLSRKQEKDIFSEENCELVANVTRKVSEVLVALTEPRAEKQVSREELHLAIEKALVRQENYDLARSLVTHRAHEIQTQPTIKVTTQLLRRNGQLVPWNANKIEIAVRKAFLALHLDSEPAVEVTQAVLMRMAEGRKAMVHIEDVQDMVQEELMKAGHFKAAEAYILYRGRRAVQRAAEDAAKPADEDQSVFVRVQRADGSSFLWDGADMRARIDYAGLGLDLNLDRSEIENELRRSIYDEMNQADLKKTILLNAKALIERDADFAKFAGRMLLTYLYEEVLDWDILQDGIGQLREAHRRGFRAYLDTAVELERLSPKLLSYDLDRLAEALDPSADLDFDYLGIQTLYDRYLIIDKRGVNRRLEVPQFFWMRVSMGLFLEEPEDREGWVMKLYNLYKSRRFCSSTPTLFNSGTLHSQLSSCYLYKVDDSIESIMIRGISENAFLSKWAGGLGGSWTAVRGTGGYIKGTNGESQGVIPFLKLHNDQLVAVNQGGKRRGSGCAYLETWHNDIIDFLELRKNTGDERRRTHDMNTANWIPDLFMKRMEAREEWTLFRANETPDLHDLYGKAFEERYHYYERQAKAGKIFSRTMPAIDLWKNILKMLFETGHPWITFKDPCNIRSPQDHCGVIHSSNLCTEITLNTGADETAVCNLGSVVLDSHLKEDGSLDHDKLRDTIQVAIRALDNVIDINFYPTDAARTSNLRHRPIGMGVMGLANALFRKNVSFASEEAVEFNDEFMEAIAYYAYEASSGLAKERGTYSTYTGSKWDRGLLPPDTLDMLEQERGVQVDVPRGGKMDWKSLREKILKHGMRNSNVLAIAPTATISNIMGTSPCIEPIYKNLFVKSNLSGDFIVLNGSLVRDLKSRGLWDQEMRDNLKYFDGELADIERIPEELRRKYSTAFGIEFDYIIRAAARRQKWIDQSQSVNLFLGNPDLKTLSHMYRAAWKSGMKTTYYLRTLGASNIEKATVSVKKAKEPVDSDKPVYTDAQKAACSLDAMLNGGECESCQ